MKRVTEAVIQRCPVCLAGHVVVWVAVFLFLGFGLGCVQRTVTVTSEPAGALVWLNDREVGRTPVTVPFTFYGMYDVRLERDGYEPLWTSQKAEAPWWETPPVDLFAEATDGRVELEWHFELEPARATDDAAVDALVDEARALRSRLDVDTP